MDYYGFFKKINDRGIKYIVVGGLAVNLHGIPRLTYDVDLLVKMTDQNLRELLEFFKELGYKPKSPVHIHDFLNSEKRNEWIRNKNMRAFCLISETAPIREIDIILNTPIDYDSAEGNVIFYDLYDTKIATISIDDLIKMKKASERKQDKMDVEHLKRLKR